MRPGDLLTGMPPQFEVRTEAEKWQGAFKQAQGAIREQGQVMSATLTNNRSLWNTNKLLRERVENLTTLAAQLERERNQFKAALDAVPAEQLEMAALLEANAELKRANAALKAALAGSLYPELDTDKRREELERVRAQEAELQATGLVPTPEDIAKADHARDAQRGGFYFGGSPAQLPSSQAIDAVERSAGCTCASSAQGHLDGCPRLALGQARRGT